jgi:predicted fused transcriptional regulator/phosphomethylpyrimidine kinase/predicted transcriptional regulator
METHNWTQSRIAKHLGVTQPAISGYLALLDREAEPRFEVEEVRNVARSIASGLAAGELTVSESVSNICELCVKLKCGGIVCAFHKQGVPELSREGCEICLSLFSRGVKPIEERYDVLMDLRRAVSLIEECKEFPEIMPEVQVNLVMGTSNAKTISDVAGIPGRIVKVRDRARAFMEPEFGASFHMAKVLLAAMRESSEFRAVIDVKFDEKVDESIKKLNFTVSRYSLSELPKEALISDVPAVWGIKKAIEKFGKVPDIIIDEGGYGVEPTTYIFGRTSVDAAKKAIQIAKTVAQKSTATS